ncbi:hypothetical protein ACGFIY_21575 [Micromonospora chersina]|uniref:hypothetical protein n=1 Tax=Micromonospora chersina TaxID=47854 RepID=UPI0037195F29
MENLTKHTCNRGRGPAFGRKTPGCPRCDELLNGAPPRDAHPAIQAVKRKRDAEAFEAAAIRAHNCAITGCGRVCTFGQW